MHICVLPIHPCPLMLFFLDICLCLHIPLPILLIYINTESRNCWGWNGPPKNIKSNRPAKAGSKVIIIIHNNASLEVLPCCFYHSREAQNRDTDRTKMALERKHPAEHCAGGTATSRMQSSVTWLCIQPQEPAPSLPGLPAWSRRERLGKTPESGKST